jgi:hypothetical protein
MPRPRTRLDRLEAKRGGSGGAPAVTFLSDAVTGDPGAALLTGGGHVREPGEAVAAFLARAAPMASIAICLPDNGRA